MLADRVFSERVLERVARAEQQRQRRERARLALPMLTIAVVVGAWAVALLYGSIALHLVIQVIARVSAIGSLERHLSGNLLGPLANAPLLISVLLFLSAIVWLRVHQTDTWESRP